MTKHDFLALLAESYEFYGRSWADEATLYANLRLNTPEEQTRWDQQARSLIPRLLKRGMIERIPCPNTRDKTVEACGRPHIALTALGRAQLEAWDQLGCDAHTHTGQCHAPDRDFNFRKAG